MGCPTFTLVYDTSPGSTVTNNFKAVDLNDAKEKAKAHLRSILTPTDRTGVSVRWAYIEHEDKKIWLVQEGMDGGW